MGDRSLRLAKIPAHKSEVIQQVRFVLLIVAVLGASLFIYNSLFFRFNGEAYLPMFRRCLSENRLPTPVDTSSAEYADRLGAVLNAQTQCLAPFQLRQAIWMLAGTALLLRDGLLNTSPP